MVANGMVDNSQGIPLREHQAETVRTILDQFKGGTRTVFLHAPVGSGKSLIHLLVSRESQSAYITTPQVLLVDQYGADTREGGKFRGLASTLYGRKNYSCPHVRGLPKGNPKATADGAPCTYLDGWPRGCPQLKQCSYYLARHSAQGAPTSVTTLQYALLGVIPRIERVDVNAISPPPGDEEGILLGPGWTHRPLLVVDEAHGLPGDLVNFYSVEVGERTLPGFGFAAIGKSDDSLAFMREHLPSYLERLTRGLAELRVSSGGDVSDELRLLKDQYELIRRVERFIETLSRDDVAWVHTYDRSPPKHRWRPLSPGPFAAPMWARFERILLSSATFFGFGTLVRDLGLPGPTHIVTVPDVFPPGNAPIYLVSTVSLNKESMPAELPVVLDELTRIAQLHRLERGMIHCNSYPVRDFIQQHADSNLASRLVFHERTDRIPRVQAWFRDGRDNSIFVGVAMSQGLDLVGDLARWQVIIKAPYPDLGDEWVLRRRDQPGGRIWYVEQTIIEILQASGRVMRSKDDRGTTYILDSNVENLIRNRWDALPEWFRRRVEASRLTEK